MYTKHKSTIKCTIQKWTNTSIYGKMQSSLFFIKASSHHWQHCRPCDVTAICTLWYYCTRFVLSSQHVHRLSTHFSLCCPLTLLSSNFPFTTRFSKPFLITEWPQSSCHWQTVLILVSWTPLSSNYFYLQSVKKSNLEVLRAADVQHTYTVLLANTECYNSSNNISLKCSECYSDNM